jgi:hypothetical protein
MNFRIGDELLHGLRVVRERDGVSVSEQVRRAVRSWLVERRVLPAPRVSGPRRAPETKRRAEEER